MQPLIIVVLAAIAVTGCARNTRLVTPASPQPATEAATLAADVWMQTSAEYTAICLQTYSSALRILRTELEAKRPANPAVIMDLDETVIDNSGFQSTLHRTGGRFTPAVWEEWVRRQATDRLERCVPGACEFIREARSLGITVVYVSNRSEQSRQHTETTLRALGIAPAEGTLFLREPGRTKENDRQTAAARYTVVAYFGDNLADFAQEFESSKDTTAARRMSVLNEKYAPRLGLTWFVLPNPSYGAWMDVLRGRPLKEHLRDH